MNKKLKAAIIITCSVVIIAAGIFLAWYLIPHKCVSRDDAKTTNVTVPVDFAELKKINPEIYAWIYIPDTNVDYPILQSAEDDNFYIDHNERREDDINGAIYSQNCNAQDFNDPVTVLYGHNMLNGSMFASLHEFEDDEFFNNHDTMYIYLPNRVLTYRIINQYVYDNRHIMNSFDFQNEEVRMRYFDSLANPHSLSAHVRKNIELNKDDKVVQLSTCLGDSSSRFLVTGVKINDQIAE